MIERDRINLDQVSDKLRILIRLKAHHHLITINQSNTKNLSKIIALSRVHLLRLSIITILLSSQTHETMALIRRRKSLFKPLNRIISTVVSNKGPATMALPILSIRTIPSGSVRLRIRLKAQLTSWSPKLI